VRRGLCAFATVLLTVGCAPLTPAADRTPQQPRDCSRQFDADDAGFQTCEEGSPEDEE
jgi:hypothetical protein